MRSTNWDQWSDFTGVVAFLLFAFGPFVGVTVLIFWVGSIHSEHSWPVLTAKVVSVSPKSFGDDFHTNVYVVDVSEPARDRSFQATILGDPDGGPVPVGQLVLVSVDAEHSEAAWPVSDETVRSDRRAARIAAEVLVGWLVLAAAFSYATVLTDRWAQNSPPTS
jgi:hypothetical protein